MRVTKDVNGLVSWNFDLPDGPLPVFRFWLWYDTDDATYLVRGTDSETVAAAWLAEPQHRVHKDPRWRPLD